MKVCILLAMSESLDDRTARVATALADSGHEVGILLGPDRRAPKSLRGKHSSIRVTSCCRFFDRRGLRGPGRILAWAQSLLRGFVRRPEVVHAIGYRTLRRGRLLSRGRTMLIYDAPDGLDSNRRRRLERRLLGAADGIVAASPTLARELAERRAGGAMPLVLRDTPQRAAAAPLRPSLRERLGVPTQPLLLQETGREAGADVDLALAALGRVPDAHLVILSPTALADDIRLASERHRVAGRVHVVRSVREGRLACYAREAHAGLCLTGAAPDSAPPPAAYRYLAGGASVIATKAVGYEQLSDGDASISFVPRDDDSALAAAIAAAIAIPPDRNDDHAWWWEREPAALVGFYERLPMLAAEKSPRISLVRGRGLRTLARRVFGLHRETAGTIGAPGLYQFTRGQRLRARRDFAGAARAFGEAVQRDPSTVRYRLSYAGALRDVGERERAIEVYREVIARSESGTDSASRTAAVALARMGMRTEAREIRDRLRARANNPPQIHASLAQLEAALGNLGEARKALAEMEASADGADARLERIRMQVHEQCGDPEAALGVARTLEDEPATRRLAAVTDAFGIDYVPPPPSARAWSGPASNARIVYLLETALPFATSGYSYRSKTVLAAQRRAGLEPTAITRLGFPANRGLIGHSPIEVVDGIVHHYLALPGVRHYTGIPIDEQLERNAEMLARIVEQVRPAALHATSPHFNGLLGLSLRETFGLAFVYEARGFPEMTWACKPGGKYSETYALRRRAETRCMLEADSVITLSEVMKAHIVERGVAEDRVYVVPHMVDVERFRPTLRDPTLEREYGLEGKTVVGYISSLVDYEGVDVLLRGIAEARRTNPDVVGLIVGDGVALPGLRELAGELGLGDAVRFTGRVPHSATIAHYSLIDIFVVPRHPWEVCRFVTPLKPFEAMAMGRCLVVSDIPALAEATGWGAHGRLFDSGVSGSLAMQIVELAGDPDLRSSLGAAARKYVVANHSFGLAPEVTSAPITAARHRNATALRNERKRVVRA